jgi:hypothetical protein
MPTNANTPKQNRLADGSYTYGSLTEPVTGPDSRGLGPKLLDVSNPDRFTPNTVASSYGITVTDDEENLIVSVLPRAGGYFEVTSVNPLGVEPMTGMFDIGFTDVSETTNDAEFSVRFAQQLLDSDTELAQHISRLSYIDSESTVAVVLVDKFGEESSTVFVNIDTGQIGVSEIWPEDSANRSPASLLKDGGRAPRAMPVKDVASAVDHIIDIPRDPDWSRHHHDRVVARAFASRVLAPILTVSNNDTGVRANAAQIVAEHLNPTAHVGDRPVFAADSAASEAAVSDLLEFTEPDVIAAGPRSNTRDGRIDARATMIAAIRLAEENPDAAQFEATRTAVRGDMLNGVKGSALLGAAAGTITDETLAKAGSLMLKSVHRDAHTEEPSARNKVATGVVLAGLSSLQWEGKFTGRDTPESSTTQLVNGSRLDGHHLLNGSSEIDSRPKEGWFSERVPPLYGIWK